MNLILLLSFVALAAADYKCTRIGGTCQDYTKNKCINGYLTKLCSGGNERRCCKPCNSYCRITEIRDATRDGKCKALGGTCQDNSNYCSGKYHSGKCGGRIARQCCIGSSSSATTCYNNIMEVDTIGASKKTSKGLGVVGIPASHKIASMDKAKMDKHKWKIFAAAKKYCVDAAVIAGIISRETRVGLFLDKNGWGKFDENGYGIMQVDKGPHTPKGAPDSQEHINQATGILMSMIKAIDKKFPTWTKKQVYKGGIAAYNLGPKNIWTYPNMDVGSPGDDYSSDVVARAQWFKANGY